MNTASDEVKKQVAPTQTSNIDRTVHFAGTIHAWTTPTKFKRLIPQSFVQGLLVFAVVFTIFAIAAVFSALIVLASSPKPSQDDVNSMVITVIVSSLMALFTSLIAVKFRSQHLKNRK